MQQEHIDKLKQIPAEFIMDEEFQPINQFMTIGDMAHIMLRRKPSGYPVVDNEGVLVGIVTFTDFFELIDRMAQDPDEDLHQKILDAKQRPVSDIMTRDVYSISPATPLNEIIDAVIQRKIHTFPVINHGKLVGIISRHDVLNATFSYG